MLFSLDGERISAIPAKRRPAFDVWLRELGEARAEEIRAELNRLIDELRPQDQTGKRVVNASYLGSDLTPWPPPLSYLHDAAASMADKGTSEAEIQEQSGFGFGLFLWDCMIGRGDSWTVYDPNLRGDPRREVLGKIYYER